MMYIRYQYKRDLDRAIEKHYYWGPRSGHFDTFKEARELAMTEGIKFVTVMPAAQVRKRERYERPW